MQEEDIKRLEAFEMWLWRRIMKVKWIEHKTNEEVLEKVKEQRMLIKTIRERQKNWVGHVLRSDSLLRNIWEGIMEEISGNANRIACWETYWMVLGECISRIPEDELMFIGGDLNGYAGGDRCGYGNIH
jgi:hypothetical protein